MREISTILSGETAKEVVEILQKERDEMEKERLKLINKYQQIERPLVKERKAHENELKALQKKLERLDTYLSVFNELSNQSKSDGST